MELTDVVKYLLKNISIFNNMFHVTLRETYVN
jgi:hypothetical protein